MDFKKKFKKQKSSYRKTSPMALRLILQPQNKVKTLGDHPFAISSKHRWK
jgi:hypothetical protein